MIGHRCKHSNVLSRVILIPRLSILLDQNHTIQIPRETVTMALIKNPISFVEPEHKIEFNKIYSLYSSRQSIMPNTCGGVSVEATPVPIPNTEVKLYSADGTGTTRFPGE